MAGPFDPETDIMNKAILAALGLPLTATEDDAVAAIATLRAAEPDSAVWVKRTDLEAAAERATTAEAALAQRTKDDEAAAVTAEVDRLIEGGFVEPAKRDAAIENCTILGPERYAKQFEGATPRLEPSGLAGRRPTPAGTGVAGLTAEELHTCKILGQDPTEYAAFKTKEAEAAAVAAA